MVNQNRLFLGSCFALITTAFSFSIRAGILPQLGAEFNLNAEQLGVINSMWFYGFPISMIIGGLVYNSVGPKTIMQIAFLCHTVGILLTLYPGLLGGYNGLLVSTFLIGIGNGCTEAACNPMIADTYSGAAMNKMLNRFHMWFPGGIFVGSLISQFISDQRIGLDSAKRVFPALFEISESISWQTQIWFIIIPTIIYAYLFWGQEFPKPKNVGSTSLSENFKAMLTPLFLFMCACMFMTASSEFGPSQWTSMIMDNSGASGMVILALTFGLMAVGRYFAGPIIEKFNQTGVLLGSAVLATIGVYLLSTANTAATAYAAAIFFGMGVCYFWPTMVGFVAENVPLSGALGMSIIGGVGMLSQAIMNPQIGRWLDAAKADQTTKGLTGKAMELAAGQDVLHNLNYFPAILIVAFGVLYFWMKKK